MKCLECHESIFHLVENKGSLQLIEEGGNIPMTKVLKLI